MRNEKITIHKSGALQRFESYMIHKYTKSTSMLIAAMKVPASRNLRIVSDTWIARQVRT